MITYDAIIVASGQGSRLNLGYNKVFYRFEDGYTILDKAMAPFLMDEDCKKIIVVTNQDDFKLVLNHQKVVVTEGGKQRQDSVYAGLKLVDSPYVLVHDGARPYLMASELKALKKALMSEDAAILAVKAKDTVKLVNDGYIEKTIDRSKVYLAQTPQGAKSSILKSLYEKAITSHFNFTDEASVLETGGIKVRVVDGSYANNKITFQADLK